MTIPLTDAAQKRKLASAAKADRDSLWQELHDIAMSFTLVGATSEALKVWRFTYSGMVPMPDPDDRTVHIAGDGAASAVCHQLGVEDISKGKPPPKYLKPNLTLKKRVEALDEQVRRSLTLDAWSKTANWKKPPPELVDTANVRQARLLAQPKPGKKRPTNEKKALKLLLTVLDKKDSNIPPYLKLDAALLAIDVLVRHQRLEDAEELLQRWHDFLIEFGSDLPVQDALGLTTVAGLICDGVLADKTKLSRKKREELVTTLINDLSQRLNQPEPPKAPQWKFKLFASYGQFYVEPLKPDPGQFC